MNGTLTDYVKFNGLTLAPGTKVMIEKDQAQMFEQLNPRDSLIATVILNYYTIRIIVRKSQINLLAEN